MNRRCGVGCVVVRWLSRRCKTWFLNSVTEGYVLHLLLLQRKALACFEGWSAVFGSDKDVR